MTQTVTSGQRTTHGAQANIIPTRYVEKAFAVLTASAAAFTYVAKMNKLAPIDTLQPKSGEDLLLKYWTTVATAYAAAATSIVVAAGTGQYFGSRDYVVNKTAGGGAHLVQYVTTDTLTVSANIDAGTSTAGAVGDELLCLGPVIEQGGPYPRAKTVTETLRTFYCYRHSTSIEFTEEALSAGSYFTPQDYPYQKKKRFAIEHVQLRDLKAWWMGLGRAVSMPTTLTDYDPDGVGNQLQVGFGYLKWLETYCDSDHNITDPDLTEPEFFKNMRFGYFAEDEPQHIDALMCYHAPELAEGMLLWNLGRGRFEGRVSKEPAALGLSWSEVQCPFGTLRMKAIPHLSSKVSGGLHRYVFSDGRFVKWQPYKDQDTHIIQDWVHRGYHERIDLITEVACPIFQQPNAHVLGRFASMS
jgi:hypothetical protein